MKRVVNYTIALLGAMLVLNSVVAQVNGGVPIIKVVQDPSVLKMELRKLWAEHASWTRNIVLCLVDTLPGKEQAIDRLQQNCDELGDAFKPCFGLEVGRNLTELLYAQLNFTVEVIETSKVDSIAAKVAIKRWRFNADAIAEFLTATNPSLKNANVKLFMNKYLDLTLDEIQQRINGNYIGEVVVFDKVQGEIIEFSDMLTKGFVVKYPERFIVITDKTASKF